MLFTSAISALAIAISAFSSIVSAQDASAQKIGYSGTLSSLDGGLGGTVTVTDPTTLQVTSYTLKDASAPALYWWGTTDGTLKNGFRISNTQVTSAATSNSLTIKLDAGKTTADFSTVGLWCEKFNANFGQATLKAGAGGAGGASNNSPSSSTPAGTSPTTTGAGAGAAPASASPTTSAKSAAAVVSTSSSIFMIIGTLAVVFAAQMV